MISLINDNGKRIVLFSVSFLLVSIEMPIIDYIVLCMKA